MQKNIAYIKFFVNFAVLIIKYMIEMVSLNKIKVQGFANIDSVVLDLQQITALLAPNNYGKSNVLNAIIYGFLFMRQLPEIRKKMMGFEPYISVNKYLAGKPYSFEIEGSIGENVSFQYGYSFVWKRYRKNEDGIVDAGGYIDKEFLKIKTQNGEKQKFTTLVHRDTPKSAKYMPSQTGRCDKDLIIDDNELVLNKLSNYDDLFYNQYIQTIKNVRIIDAEYLSDPEEFFALKMVVQDEKHKYLSGGQIASYLYNLKKEDPDTYALLLSAITILIPAIESIEPIVIMANKLKVDDDAPYEYPDQHELVVKEKYNNQQTRFQYLSTGSMKLLYLLTTIIRASREGVQLLLVEELENSIHPSLLHALLDVVKSFLGNTKLLFTSHSPNLLKYMTAPQIYVGLPSNMGEADFRTIKSSKVKSVLQIASAGEMAFGEYLFELLQDAENDPSLIDVYFTQKKGG